MLVDNNRSCNHLNFTGYVSPWVKRSVSNSVNYACEEYLRMANRSNTSLEIKNIQDCKALGKQILETLDEAMKKFHKDTVLTLDPQRLVTLKNKKTNTVLPCFSKSPNLIYHKDVGDIEHGYLLINPRQGRNTGSPLYMVENSLKSMLDFAQLLKDKVQPKDVDKYLFECHLERLQRDASKGVFSRLRALRKAKNAQNMAEEFGVKADGITYGVKRRAALAKISSKNKKNMHQQRTQNVKDLREQNIKEFERIMNA